MLVISALLLTVFALLFGADRVGFWATFQRIVLGVFGQTDDYRFDESSGLRVLEIVIGIIAMVAPALVLGAVVYKVLLLRDVLTIKQEASVMWTDRGYALVVRFYNSTPLTIVSCNFDVYLRQPFQRTTNARYVTNISIELEKSEWPISQSGVPFTLRIPLEDDDYDFESRRLKSIQRHALEEKWRLAVLVSALVPDLGTTSTEVYWIKSTDISLGAFTEIDVDYDTDPIEWKGWQGFELTTGIEEQEPQFVFGYGSLNELVASGVSRRQSTRGYIGTLTGFRRCWNTAMCNAIDIAGYKYYTRPEDGTRPDVFVTFLDIVEDPNCEINGVCLPVTRGSLDVLDSRELNYERVEVTSLLSESPPGRVWAYLGSPDGRDRASRGRATGTCIVQKEYLSAVRDGFARLGDRELKLFDATTRAPNMPVVSLVRHEIGSSPTDVAV